MADYEVGDQVVVTGDTCGLNHHFSDGTEVTVIHKSKNDEDRVFCAYPLGSLVRGLPRPYRGEERKGWWVAIEDLEPIITDEEVNAAIESIKGAVDHR